MDEPNPEQYQNYGSINKDVLTYMLPFLEVQDVTQFNISEQLTSDTNEYYRLQVNNLYNQTSTYYRKNESFETPPQFRKWSRLYELLSKYDFENALSHITNEDIDVAQVILNNYSYSELKNMILEAEDMAVKKNQLEYIKFLIKSTGIVSDNLLIEAITDGSVEMVEYLLDLPDIKLYNVYRSDEPTYVTKNEAKKYLNEGGELAYESPIAIALEYSETSPNIMEKIGIILHHPKGKELWQSGNWLLLQSSNNLIVVKYILSIPEITFNDRIRGYVNIIDGFIENSIYADMVDDSKSTQDDVNKSFYNLLQMVLLIGNDERISVEGSEAMLGILVERENMNDLERFLSNSRIREYLNSLDEIDFNYGKFFEGNQLYELMSKYIPNIKNYSELKEVALTAGDYTGDYSFIAKMYGLSPNDSNYKQILDVIKYIRTK